MHVNFPRCFDPKLRCTVTAVKVIRFIRSKGSPTFGQQDAIILRFGANGRNYISTIVIYLYAYINQWRTNKEGGLALWVIKNVEKHKKNIKIIIRKKN